MELIVWLAAIGLVIYLLYLFVRYVIIPVGGIVFSVIGGIALIVGFISAVRNYVLALRQNLNFRNWEWKKDDEPAKRSYFFGPGYQQLIGTIKTVFSLNAVSGGKVKKTSSKFRGKSTGFWGGVRAFCGIFYLVVADVCIYVVGTTLCVAFGLIHGTITVTIMLISYVIFTIVWILDRLYLLKNKIRSDCPYCHSRYLIPAFMCPECGEIHKKLVPGPYGIFKHKCTCGYKLPSTFLVGRSRLEAFCPDCKNSIVASDARPVVFQLVGGSKAGKTVYLAAYFHQFLENLHQNGSLEIRISEQYQPFFDELEEWFRGGDCPSTRDLNSQMYPLLINSPLGIKRQFSIYDIAGEMFEGVVAESVIQQQQFHYCNGLLFLLDPFSSGNLRNNRINAGEDMADFSNMPVEDVAASFINYLIRTGHAKANSRCDIPVAVLIAKADVKEIKRVIGPAKIDSIFRNNAEKYGTYEVARDSICRQFLIDIGLASTVENLETQFSNLHYFAVSAMGHSANGTSYEPWGVMDAIEWMLPLADKDFSNLILPKEIV